MSREDWTKSITVSPPIPWNQDQTHDILDQCSYAHPLYISRINRIPPHQSWRVYVLGIIFGFGLLCYVVAFSLTIWRRNKQPLKDRSVLLLLISGVSGSFGLAYMYSRLYFDLILVCPITYYIVGFIQFSYFLPYIFRCYRTIMQYKLAEAQSQIMKENEQDTTQLALQSFNSSYIRRKKRREKRLAAELGESLLDSSSDISSDTASYALDSNVGLKKMPLYTTVANSDKYSRLFRNQFYFSERFLVILVSVILLAWGTLIFIIHMILLFSEDIINPKCQKRCNEQEGIAVRVYVGITILLILPFAYLLVKMRKINDAFSIRKEMTIMLFFSIFVVAVPMIVLIAVPNQFWPQQPTIGYFLGIELLGSFFISILFPLSSTWTRNMDMSKFNIFSRKRMSTPTTQAEQPVVPVYETFEFFLTDINAREVFKQFLVREFHVESLMFCLEVEYYKGLDVDDENSLKEVSKKLFETYIQIGSPFEVNIPGSLRDEISKNISKPNMRTFDRSKEEVIRNMQKGSFIRFKKSSLFENFVSKRFGK